MLTDTRSSPAEYEHLSDTSLYTLEIGAARFAQLQKLRLFAAWSSFRRKSYPAQCKHCLTLQLHYLRWFTLYNKIYFWNIKSSCCDICGYQTTNFSITKTLPSQQNMIDDQLCFTREPIEQLISIELFASCVPSLAQFPPLPRVRSPPRREEINSRVAQKSIPLVSSHHIIIAKTRDLLHNYPACFALLSLKERDILHTLLKFRATWLWFRARRL